MGVFSVFRVLPRQPPSLSLYSLGDYGFPSMSDAIKRAVLQKITHPDTFYLDGRATYAVGSKRVHVRFCSADRSGSSKFKYNINPNTLASDFELWICGSADCYYLVPMSVISDLYSDPAAYPDRHHPEIRIVALDADTHALSYAAKRAPLPIDDYFRRVLSDFTVA